MPAAYPSSLMIRGRTQSVRGSAETTSSASPAPHAANRLSCRSGVAPGHGASVIWVSSSGVGRLCPTTSFTPSPGSSDIELSWCGFTCKDKQWWHEPRGAERNVVMSGSGHSLQVRICPLSAALPTRILEARSRWARREHRAALQKRSRVGVKRTRKCACSRSRQIVAGVLRQDVDRHPRQACLV